MEMAFQIIWPKLIIIQYIILDFIGKKTLEKIDCRTLEGQERYIELYGFTRFKSMLKKYGDETNSFRSANQIIISKSMSKTLFSNLNERTKRLIAGFLALSLTSRKKIELAKFIGIDPKTIQRGIKELLSSHNLRKNQIRRSGGGRKTLNHKFPYFNSILEELAEDHLAGDPMNANRWVRKSLAYFKDQLHMKGITASLTSIRTYFKKHKISLKSTIKCLSAQQHKDRDLQFKQINRLRKSFLKAGKPVISIDTKKKEKIGLFKKAGKLWRKLAKKAFDHDFKNLEKATVIPFGIYDLKYNKGYIYCNTSHETAQFQVEMIVKWWVEVGHNFYRNQKNLLILCDSGGRNSYRSRGWKCELQEQLASAFGIRVTVSHYPPGTSKWNVIEHKLFSFISINWAGEILDSIEKMLAFINSTTTKTGLTVEGVFIDKFYKTKIQYPNNLMDRLNLRLWNILPQWNYSLFP